MRVNSKVLTQKTDLMGNINITNCPTQFRYVAENLMTMLTKLDYSVGDYNSVTKLDKLLTIDYWQEYDQFIEGLDFNNFKLWFVGRATEADLISRARRWLVEHNYIFLKESVAKRAHQAGDKFSKAVSSK